MISVIIPAYNEENCLAELFLRTKATMDGLEEEFEFIIVDDGSTDGTAAVALSLVDEYRQVVYIQHRRNFGKSAALMRGFEAARGCFIVMMDADLQDHPEDIPDLVAPLRGEVDLVNGWRSERKDTGRKRFVSSVYNKLVTQLLGTRLHDINCGIKAMRRDVCQSLQLTGDLHRLIPAIAQIQGFKVTEVKVRHADRRHGASRYPLLRYRGILDLIALVGLRGLQASPLHFFTKISLVFWLSAVVAAIAWAATGRWLSHETPVIRVISPLLGAFSWWLVMVGTMLPVLGFYMEVSMFRTPNDAWRGSAVRRVVRNGDSADR
ncbi:glycosyltransferase family 2 protein [Magnetospirillum sp. UT-4]|uniref:glycosyltransferase family 2 protein n=1 Tax=Magnetospirillum sp. UT-4 TaxID=2681467 RepID=UPI0013820171|nr:glycosyltransferase family 2 protein [Magnetospirillum sp. UT-4]CAA7612148.1 Glycosyl transferase family 2 [Magnetospirillum sp. UT-4]